MSLKVTAAGLMSLLMDAGRFGKASLGLTQGGPVDPFAFELANHLVGNESNTTAIEVTLGGLSLQAQTDCVVSVTGAGLPVKLNGRDSPMWRAFVVRAGESLELGQPESALRSYVAVQGGFAVTPQFGSTSTVMREGIGGLNGNKLQTGDLLPLGKPQRLHSLALAEPDIPAYSANPVLRLIPGYQFKQFSAVNRALFFASEYEITGQADRMGYRLKGQGVAADIQGMLSEGISLGAVQVPADGQPIVLLNDRQTIGGYPKLGNVLSLDCTSLAQCRPGTKVSFEAISMEQAHNLLHLHRAFKQRLLEQLEPVDA
ncbi:5-oxoprolinase subunit C family protein [Bowmanella dokdonensis]|uniref:Biotin-dependent carboxyltransferase n=1 Tax=Bowmanella dokdonensis TaxID=751969 RepID=A0A939DMN8_9ALTE|nr:biotin-dependent carboxyltransferase family protein [Bowmanella dokdonensis]MBN7825293.1 biotin-dependent carboxyltransferase [Bowmanella dokdonensis]